MKLKRKRSDECIEDEPAVKVRRADDGSSIGKFCSTHDMEEIILTYGFYFQPFSLLFLSPPPRVLSFIVPRT